MRIFITGRPGIGKTTVFMKTIDLLKKRGLKIIGFYCPEVREGGRRVGFKIVDIETGESGWLAVSTDKIGGECIKRIGRYCLVHEDAERISRKISEKIDYAEIIGIDEIGPMELSIYSLKDLIYKMLNTDKKGLYVVHEKIVKDLSKNFSAIIYEINEFNRDKIYIEIYQRLTKDL